MNKKKIQVIYWKFSLCFDEILSVRVQVALHIGV